MATLYVTDLDGTLLRSDEHLSSLTVRVINALVDQGMRFSYATARSFITASKVTAGLQANFPRIVYNGTMAVDADGTLLLRNFFGPDAAALMADCIGRGVYPIVYAFVDGVEKFSFLPEKCTAGMRAFLDTRRGDVRTRAVETVEALCRGEVFYLTCIDEEAKLAPLYEKYRDRYACVYHTDIYTKTKWLEIMPKAASKAHAIQQLRAQMGCDRLVVFGDAVNDINMFELADEAYAVGNAVDALKAIATGVIGSNDEDGVARWLAARHGLALDEFTGC